MQFKIKNTIVTISFTYLALILVLISLNKTEFLYSTLIFAMLHEAGHIGEECRRPPVYHTESRPLRR